MSARTAITRRRRKGGNRPRLDPKNIQFNFRLSRSELVRLVKVADHHGLSYSDTVRMLLKAAERRLT